MNPFLLPPPLSLSPPLTHVLVPFPQQYHSSQELGKELAQLKERQAKAEAEAAAAAEAEVPLKQELKQAQAEFDRFKQEIEGEDGRSVCDGVVVVGGW